MPRSYLEIQRKCMDPDQRLRPTFSELLEDLLAVYSSCMEAMSAAKTSAAEACVLSGGAVHPSEPGTVHEEEYSIRAEGDLKAEARSAGSSSDLDKKGLESATSAPRDLVDGSESKQLPADEVGGSLSPGIPQNAGGNNGDTVPTAVCEAPRGTMSEGSAYIWKEGRPAEISPGGRQRMAGDSGEVAAGEPQELFRNWSALY